MCGHIVKVYRGNGDIYILIPYRYGKGKAVCGHIVKVYRGNGDIYILIQSVISLVSRKRLNGSRSVHSLLFSACMCIYSKKYLL